MQMQEEIVSLVVPVYEVEVYLSRALDSVLAQTYAAWEMILVDDGSPDRCGEICDAYAARDSRIHVIHQKNGGLSAARNTGMRHCTGKYLMFLDSDDYLAPDALEFLVRRAEEGPYDIVMAGHYRVEPDGSTPNQSEMWEESTDFEKIRHDILLNVLPNFAWGKLYRRTLWEGVSFPQGRLVEDLSAVAPVFCAASSACVCRTPLYFYSHENLGSIMSRPDMANYIRIRVGRFFGWQVHEQLAARFDPEYQEFCALQALRAGIRALMLDTKQTVLAPNDRREIIQYVERHPHTPLPGSFRMQASFIRHDRKRILRILGSLQKWLVLRQTEHRFEKLKKKTAQIEKAGGRV